MKASPRYANYVLGVMLVVYVFNFVDRQILSILLPSIKAELDVSDTALGFLIGPAFAIFYTFAGIPIARWADKGTRRTIIALSVAAWSVMTAVSGLSRTFGHLALARIGVGVGEAGASPPAHSLISDYFPPERRATALAIYTVGAYIGILLGLVGGGWIDEFFGWRTAFYVVGIPGLLLAVIVRWTVREPPRGEAEGLALESKMPTAKEVFTFLWARRSFRHLCLAASLYGFAGYGLMFWAPTFLQRVHEMGKGESGTWLGLILGLGGAAGTYLGGRIADRLGARDARWHMWICALGSFISLPFAALFLLWPTAPTALLAFYLPMTILAQFYVGPTYAMTQGLATLRMRALAAAILLFLMNLIGLGLGPQLVGFLSEVLQPAYGKESLRYALLIVLVSNLWAVFHSLAAARTLRQDLQAKDEIG